MIVLHASFPIDPDRLEEALSLVGGLVEASNREDGVIDYRAATDVQDGTVVRFFEQYADEAAFETHAQSEHFAAFQERLPELLVGAPEVTRFDVAAATELEV